MGLNRWVCRRQRYWCRTRGAAARGTGICWSEVLRQPYQMTDVYIDVLQTASVFFRKNGPEHGTRPGSAPSPASVRKETALKVETITIWWKTGKCMFISFTTSSIRQMVTVKRNNYYASRNYKDPSSDRPCSDRPGSDHQASPTQLANSSLQHKSKTFFHFISYLGSLNINILSNSNRVGL